MVEAGGRYSQLADWSVCFVVNVRRGTMDVNALLAYFGIAAIRF
jgi:hypothetical protein